MEQTNNNNWICPRCQKENPSTNFLCNGCSNLKPTNLVSYFNANDTKEENVEAPINFENVEIEINTDGSFHPDISDKLNNEDSCNNDDMTPIDNSSEYYVSPIQTPSYKQTYQDYERADWFKLLGLLIGINVCLALLFTITFYVKSAFEDNDIVFSTTYNNYCEETITGFSWERCVVVEDLKTVEESGEVLPEDAKLLYEQEEISLQDKEVEFYVTIDESEVGEVVQKPIYKEFLESKVMYYYEIEKWVHNRYEKTSGNDKSPYWANPATNDNQRSIQYYEKYWIHVVDENEQTFSYSCDEDVWQMYNVGDKLVYSTDILGNANSDIKLIKQDTE